MNRAILLNTPELPCPGTHYFHTVKFLSSFAMHGYTAIEARSMQDFVSLSPDAGDIVYISNHGFSTESSRIGAFEAMHAISRLDCVFILWFFHDVISTREMPCLKRWILTGEHFRREPVTSPHRKFWEIQKSLSNYVPLTFAASFEPQEVGRFERQENFSSSFVGHPYQVEWCSRLQIEHNALIKYTPPFISEQERLGVYLSSVVALGFHSENNAKNSVIVERVFEGLALGNVVVSDNPACEEATDGIVKFVNSYESLSEEISRFWLNKPFRALKQKAGVEWCKEHGTYASVSRSFIEKARSI